MFIPRQVNIKRKRIPENDDPPQKKLRKTSESSTKEQCLPSQRVKQSISTSTTDTHSVIPTPALDGNTSNTYDEELIHGLELILSDYAYAHDESARWLKARERTLSGDGESGYIHLSAFFEHKVFDRTKPALTQTALQRALQSQGSELLELSPDGYHIHRRHGSTPPSKTQEINWDAQTIYVEPHLSTLAANAPRLIHHLLRHSTNLPDELKPIQNIQSRHPSWAFVTFSAPTDHVAGDVWPEDWIVLTKGEHARRDEEYRNLIPIHRYDRRVVMKTVGGGGSAVGRDEGKGKNLVGGKDNGTNGQGGPGEGQTGWPKEDKVKKDMGNEVPDTPVNKHIRFQ